MMSYHRRINHKSKTIMITIPDKNFASTDITLEQILGSMTKVKMLEICKKLDLYVSPNVRKEETARRLEDEILASPGEVLYKLSKIELLALEEFMKGDDHTYVVRKMRKTPYMLQKLGLVVTYCDYANEQWHMLMPDNVKKSLAPYYGPYLDLAKKGIKAPSPKELRMRAALRRFFGEE